MARNDIHVDGDPSDHDLLIRIDERLQKVDTCLANHLRHHWRITVLALSIALGVIAAIVLRAF